MLLSVLHATDILHTPILNLSLRVSTHQRGDQVRKIYQLVSC
jgi:hypothetical protein